MNVFSDTGTGRDVTRKEQREATRDKVMLAAADLFFRNGFKATTIREIAAAAGVSVGTVMAVGDKARLLVKIFDHGIGSVHAARADAIDGRAATTDRAGGEGTVDQLLQLFEPFLDMFATQNQLARDYGAILMGGDHQSAIFDDLAGTLRQEIADVLVQSGFTEEQAAHAATTVHLSYLGTLFAWAGSGEIDPAEPIQNLRNVLTFVVDNRRQ